MFVIFYSCAKNTGGQRSAHLDSKGLTGQAIPIGQAEYILGGETSTFGAISGQKSAYLLALNENLKSIHGIAIGEDNQSFRIERLNLYKDIILSSGYGWQDKQAFVASFNKDLKPIWVLSNPQLRSFEEPRMACNIKGQSLLVSKNPNAEPYMSFLSLITSEGTVQWVKKLDQVDVMGDVIGSLSGDFIIGFKQKGAYIDGGTRKKYYMNTVIRVLEDGSISNQVKILVDREKFMDFQINTILESKNGDIFLMGLVIDNSNRTDLLIMKMTSNLRIAWANTYKTNKELSIKAALINTDGKIVVSADAYARGGGIFIGCINSNGDFLWNSFAKSTQYDQVKNLFETQKGYLAIIDKTLSAGFIYSNKTGQMCFGDCSVLSITKTDANLFLSNNSAELLADSTIWNKVDLNIKVVDHIDVSNDCGK